MIFMMQYLPHLPLSSRATVAEILDAYPQTIRVFFDHHMICVGCVMAEFDTLEDAAANYNIPIAQLLEELDDQIRGD